MIKDADVKYWNHNDLVRFLKEEKVFDEVIEKVEEWINSNVLKEDEETIFNEGYDDGYEEGYEVGYDEGCEAGEED